jgi:hypothetical protein
MISQQDIKTFRGDGFILKRGLLNAEQMREIAAMTDEIAAWPEAPGKWMMYLEPGFAQTGERLLSRIENFFPYHADFQEHDTGLRTCRYIKVTLY